MGALAGTITMTCYHVKGEVPKDFKERYLKALEKHRFTDINVDQDHEESIGWVTAADPFDTEFDLNKVVWGSYFLAAIRHDTIRLPATAFKLHLKRAVEEHCKKTGKERLSKAEVEEVRDLLEKQLKKRALPNIKVYDMVWNMDRGVVWLWSTNRKVNEQFVDFFEETFELVPHEKNPYSQLELLGFDDAQLGHVLEIEPASMAAPPGDPKAARQKSSPKAARN
jgi:recombination associated protein RdgC